MPENHDTDFNWPDFVEKIKPQLNGAYGNYVNRIMSLGNKLGGDNPLSAYDLTDQCVEEIARLGNLRTSYTSLNRHRYKEALRHVMSAAQYGNQMIQKATPWQYIGKEPTDDENYESNRLASLSIGIWLAIGQIPCHYISAILAIQRTKTVENVGTRG